jgi:hypothetical protein
LEFGDPGGHRVNVDAETDNFVHGCVASGHTMQAGCDRATEFLAIE